MNRNLSIILIFVAVFFIFFWGEKSEPDLNKLIPAEIMQKFSDGMQVDADGIRYRIVRKGTGRRPQITDRVQVHYRGFFLDGRVFDSSYKVNQPAIFPVNGVISGWTKILLQMQEGETWEAIIPSHLAYGSTGAGNLIPPNTDLCFQIEFIKIY
jgi:FKBP-type peptidyl-prolyl cis-trans isomerase FklB